MKNIEEELVRLEQEVMKFKTSQKTAEDSIKFYTYTVTVPDSSSLTRVIFDTSTGKDALVIATYRMAQGQKILPEAGYFNRWIANYGMTLFIISTQPGIVRTESV